MTVSCPACGHTFTPSAPDPTVLDWFRGTTWSGEMAADEAYTQYLGSTSRPVSRDRFVSDLAYLGVEHVLDGEDHMLIRS